MLAYEPMLCRIESYLLRAFPEANSLTWPGVRCQMFCLHMVQVFIMMYSVQLEKACVFNIISYYIIVTSLNIRIGACHVESTTLGPWTMSLRRALSHVCLGPGAALNS